MGGGVEFRRYEIESFICVQIGSIWMHIDVLEGLVAKC